MDSNIQISQTIDVDDFKNLLCGAWHYCHYFLNVDCDPASSWFFHLYPAKWKNNATIEEMVWAYLKDGHKLNAHDVESDESVLPDLGQNCRGHEGVLSGVPGSLGRLQESERRRDYC